MPRRSNPFQRLIKHVYFILEPKAIKISESEILLDDEDGREIDIYAEIQREDKVEKLAIECRDHSRPQTVEWIDGLIGKTIDLGLDTVVAVSSSGFTEAAERKAKRHNIDLLTLQQAERVDWASKLIGGKKTWKRLTHQYSLMRIGISSRDGKFLVSTEIDWDGNCKHENALSEALYPQLRQLFLDKYREEATRLGDAEIGKCWEKLIDNPHNSYFELDVKPFDGFINTGQEKISIGRMCFGIGIMFTVTEADEDAYVIGDYLIRSIEVPKELPLPGRTFLHMVSDKEGKFAGSSMQAENEPFDYKK